MLAPLGGRAPFVVFERRAEPVSRAVRVPVSPLQFEYVPVRVPFCTVLPANVMGADVAWIFPPKSKIPAFKEREHEAAKRLRPPTKRRFPALSVVLPEYAAGVAKPRLRHPKVTGIEMSCS